jgi:hypothetical protein
MALPPSPAAPNEIPPPTPDDQFIKGIDVHGMILFAVSGFLITASWLSNPRLRIYFAARGLRIVPGLWACLIITAFVIAPIGVAIQGGPATKCCSPAPQSNTF